MSTQTRGATATMTREARNARMAELYRAGRTMLEIAGAEGVTKMRVSQILRQLGVTHDARRERSGRRRRALYGQTQPVVMELTPLASRILRAVDARTDGVGASAIVERVVRAHGGGLTGREFGH